MPALQHSDPTPAPKGFVIKLKGASGSPWVIRRRVPVWLALLDGAACDGTRPHGRKLRKYGAVILEFPDGTQKVIKGLASLVEGQPPKAQWKYAAADTRKILKAISAYSAFAVSLMNHLRDRAANVCPVDHPQLYYARYVKHMFGTVYRDKHARVVEAALDCVKQEGVSLLPA